MFSFKVWYKKHKLEIIVITLVLIMLLILLIRAAMVVIQPGEEGVRWHRLFSGTELTRSYPEGTQFIYPWDKMYLYNMRLQKLSSHFNVLAKNGVNVDVEITLHFRPVLENLPMLHKFIGPDYINILVLPKVGSHVRELFAQYEPEELFSVYRQQIEKQLLVNLVEEMADTAPEINLEEHVTALSQQRETKDLVAPETNFLHYVKFENMFITSVTLPERVVEAIEIKEATKQQAMAFQHRLEIEVQEKARKKLEAEGIRDFQNTINEGISDRYLAWKGIEATLELAKSENAKVVVIGSAKDGLPIILGGEYTASTKAPTPAKPTKKD